ncbi:MAG: gliding motility-associated C-terminal domain-containing protein [Bacteroidia bacterium]|nr:gliding motility-associated C-terminal domain-containing protein [Bacteroidia bacterium]
MNKLVVTLLFVLCSLNSYTSLSQPATPGEDKGSCLTYIPKAISPNGDGINDFFMVQPQCELRNYSLQIFDEANQLLHESNEIERGWDGSFDGAPVPEGHYSYTITYEETNSNTAVSLHGEFIVVR